ncbi:DUF4429 domain-containing protein [soil metagenome]
MDMRVEGSNGTVVLDADKLRISHKGFANLLTQGSHGEKSIPLRNITAVQFKAAGWTAGYIQFTLIGGIDRPGGVMEATKDENAVLFVKEQQKSFEELKSEVERRVEDIHRAPVTSGPADASTGLADELERLARLVERGFLTRTEFEASKAKLLG